MDLFQIVCFIVAFMTVKIFICSQVLQYVCKIHFENLTCFIFTMYILYIVQME